MEVERYIRKIVNDGDRREMEELSDILVEVVDIIKKYDEDCYDEYKKKLYKMAYGNQINEDVAKEVICDVYGVNVEDYDSLDEAYAAVTGYNLDLARELLTKAYNQAIADGKLAESDRVVFTVGSSELTEGVQRQFDYLKAAF